MNDNIIPFRLRDEDRKPQQWAFQITFHEQPVWMTARDEEEVWKRLEAAGIEFDNVEISRAWSVRE